MKTRSNGRKKRGPSKIDGVYYDLRDRILAGEFQVGSRLPAESELEQIFGVSRGTVRYALDRLDTDGLIYRKRSSGSYISPRSKVRRIILVTNYPGDATLNDFGQVYGVHSFALGMNQRLVDHACNCFLMTISYDKYLDTYEQLHLLYRDVAAVVFFRNIDSLRESVDYLQEHKIPYLFYGSAEHDLKRVEHHLTYDPKEMAEIGVGCLLEHGHHDIAYVYSGHRSGRVKIHEAFLRKHPEVESFVSLNIDDLSIENIRLKLKGFSSVFCMADRMAIRFTNMLIRAGVKVPEEVSIVSIDNYPACEDAIVPITSVDIPLKNDGFTCMRFIDDMLAGKPGKLETRSKLSLVERQTVQHKLPSPRR